MVFFDRYIFAIPPMANDNEIMNMLFDRFNINVMFQIL
jgi:hypothetical protein